MKDLSNLAYQKIRRYLAILSILVAATTWVMDILKLVDQCVYCQTERSIIGLLGLLMLISTKNFYVRYLATVLGFYGAHVAATQVFNNFYNHAFDSEFLYLAAGALFLIIAQLIVFWQRN